MEHSGHRKRLIEKLEREALLEHEVLETLLCNAVPRKNTNDLAHRLLAEFGTVPAVLGTPLSALKKVEGVGDSVAAYLRCIGTFCELYYSEYRERFPTVYDEKTFGAFVGREYMHLTKETFDCYMIEKSGKILQRKRFSSGASDFVSVDPKMLGEILATNGIAGIILVHNHPAASSRPSAADHDLTKQCQYMCAFHNLLFCDHIICGKDGIFSYYQEGMMVGISKNCTVRQLLAEGNYGEK